MKLSDPQKSVFLLILMAVPFFVYLSTMSPVVYLGDSGELTAAAFSLGIPHGSGYPLYTLLGKLFCLIPLGNVGFRMNLMSAFFASASLWLVYSLVHRITASKLAAFVGALLLAFVSEFWFQTVAAEVYALHVFFVILLMRLLWWWDERREFSCLMTIVFVTGISFGNHLQTVMLAPAVLFLVLSADKKTLFEPKNIVILSIVFILALSIYVYLPIRTEAGAAIHWGDPNSLGRFLAQVSGRTHRAVYVFNETPLEYLIRTKETLWFVWSQFGVVVLLSLWGWLVLAAARWRVFFVLVIVFDFAYAIFLNTISLEITPFVLPTIVILTVLAGVGISDLLKRLEAFSPVGRGSRKVIKAAFCLIPAVFLSLNYGVCNQSRNYTAYEHALNIFRTTGNGDILLLEGDNNLFPVIYGRIVERMREDDLLFDRQYVVFKLPYLGEKKGRYYGEWEEFRAVLEKSLLEKMQDSRFYYAVFDPSSVSLPAGYELIPEGMLYHVVKQEELNSPYKIRNTWNYYSTESLYDFFDRDYHNRQIDAHFLFKQGQYLFMAGNPEKGLEYLNKASQVGYDDLGIHAALAIFFLDRNLFEPARPELEKSLVYHTDPSVPQNNWGVYHFRRGEYQKSVEDFKAAIRIRPKVFSYYKNLGHALYKLGREKEAVRAFEKSLTIHGDQPDVEKFMEENGFK